MQKLEVFGANKLKGQIKISGSKNASLPILAATLLSDKKINLLNIPKVKDIETMIELLKSLGSKIIFKNNKINIDNSNQSKKFASYNLVKTMRAGILVLGPLLGKFGSAKVSLPGGCAIGTRPVDIHLKALSKLGVKFKIVGGYVYANAPKGLIGSNIKFSKISVGATENLIIAACFAKGRTVLSNCAIEPEIKDLVNFLKKTGCKIEWVSKRKIKIFGVSQIKDISYSVMFDRIEAGTYLIAAALTNGNLTIQNLEPNIIKTEIDIIRKMGAKIKLKKNSLNIIGKSEIKNMNIKTELTLLKKVGAKIKTTKKQIHIIGPKKIKNISNLVTKEYPNFPTDLQAQFMVLLCKAKGKSSITESIFENRFMHVAELRRLGAEIVIKKNKALIFGNTSFKAAELMSSDLRASVALVLAAMVAKGSSIINRIYHLDRGYENIENKLRKVGVNIKRIS